MAALPITSVLAAVFAISLVALSFPISLRRITVGQMIGDSTDEALRRRIRTQGNFIEYVPLGVISLGLVEAHAAPAWMVVTIGTALAFGRLLHAIGMLQGLAPVRGFGMLFNLRRVACCSWMSGYGRFTLVTWMSADSPLRHLLRLHKGGRYKGEPDI